MGRLFGQDDRGWIQWTYETTVVPKALSSLSDRKPDTGFTPRETRSESSGGDRYRQRDAGHNLAGFERGLPTTRPRESGDVAHPSRPARDLLQRHGSHDPDVRRLGRQLH